MVHVELIKSTAYHHVVPTGNSKHLTVKTFCIQLRGCLKRYRLSL